MMQNDYFKWSAYFILGSYLTFVTLRNIRENK
jgi:hypothetical protein